MKQETPEKTYRCVIVKNIQSDLPPTKALEEIIKKDSGQGHILEAVLVDESYRGLAVYTPGKGCYIPEGRVKREEKGPRGTYGDSDILSSLLDNF